MMGTPENDAAGSFWQADVEEAAQKLATILQEENADVLTIYDKNGVYGHPDHIKVWEVGVARGRDRRNEEGLRETRSTAPLGCAACGEGDGPARTIETVDGVDKLVDLDAAEAQPTIEFPLGVEEEELTTAVDVKDYVDMKKKAMRAHASQITEESFFLKMPDDVFAEGFGTEWFILRGAPAGVHEYDLFTGSLSHATITLVRHGKAAAGWEDKDPPLDDTGRAQAEAMALAMGDEPRPLFVSPLRRTRETAAALERLWGIDGRSSSRASVRSSRRWKDSTNASDGCAGSCRAPTPMPAPTTRRGATRCSTCCVRCPTARWSSRISSRSTLRSARRGATIASPVSPSTTAR